RLGEFLARGRAQEVARIRPLALARRLGLPADQVVAACLHGARAGLLVLLWDVLCPECRLPSDVKDSLLALREHDHCAACQVDFRLDFANSVEMIFRVHAEVRASEFGTYGVGGRAPPPQGAAQLRLGRGECAELVLKLAEGAYRLRGPQLPWAVDFRVDPAATAGRWDLLLTAGRRPTALALRTGG